jgi:pyruvate/2-oxoglutarate dehydrogenase complex dihydrolipoamide dehydrogenase (E3) component
MNSGFSAIDENDADLLRHVHPADWVNPRPQGKYNLVVIGAGTAGLVAAAGAAGLGARVALIERGLMGGDCLNVGCVPSKVLLAAAAERHRGGAGGSFSDVMSRVRAVRASIAPHDSAARFRGLGVDVFFGDGRFLDAQTVEVAGERLRFARAVIATGARARALEVAGAATVRLLTNETVFNLTTQPRRLVVIGGGPIGCELAQAFQRLGTAVTVVASGDRLLPREEADAAAVVQARLVAEGVRIVTNAEVRGLERREDGTLMVELGGHGPAATLEADEALVAIGRAPNVEGLGLEAAGVVYDPRRGVQVDDHLRSSVRTIFACGDVAMRWKFTHAADFAARIVLQNALFRGRKRLSALNVPWCTYTDPELAHTGLGALEAAERGIAVQEWTRPFGEVDRARAEGVTEGFVRIRTRAGSDRIVGATIVGPRAGDLISEVSVAMAGGLGLGRLASVIHPYPTRAEAIRQLGDAYNRTRLTPRVKSLFARWLAWQRR